jgi:cell division protein FtsL
MARTSTARAPQRRPAPAPKPVRPPLRIVDPAELQKLKPARIGTFAGVLLFVALFALAAFQTVLINSQSRLDDLNDSVAAEHERREQLDLALADLQSPERITSVARERLGMIAPYNATFLESAADDDARAALPPTVGPPTASPPETEPPVEP